jgi:hypothetical protein
MKMLTKRRLGHHNCLAITVDLNHLSIRKRMVCMFSELNCKVQKFLTHTFKRAGLLKIGLYDPQSRDIDMYNF